MTEWCFWKYEDGGRYEIYDRVGVFQGHTHSEKAAIALTQWLLAHPEERYSAKDAHDDQDRVSPMGLCGMSCQKWRAEAVAKDALFAAQVGEGITKTPT